MVGVSPASSTNKTGRRDIAEILLKVALKHQKSKSNQTRYDSNRMLLPKVSQTSPFFSRVLVAILKMAEILKILKTYTCYHYPFRSYQH